MEYETLNIKLYKDYLNLIMWFEIQFMSALLIYGTGLPCAYTLCHGYV